MVKQCDFLFLIILFGILINCKNPASNASIPVKEVAKEADTLQLSGKSLIIAWGENGLPLSIIPLDDGKSPHGYAIHYAENGTLSTISQWKKGMRDGNAFVFEEGNVETHQLFDAGELIYQGKYEEKVKKNNELYPQFVEEFFFEDKYYAKIRFTFAYRGEIKVQVQGYQAEISPLPDRTFQLVVNDALDLDAFDLNLTYQPGAQDTLVGSEYTITHIVYED